MNYNGIAYYVGDFEPPIIAHLNTAISLERRKEINQVIIIVAPGKLSADKKDDLWKILLRSAVTANVRVEISEKESSLSYLYSKLMKQPDTACYIALDEQSARKPAFAKHFNKFPHVEIELIPSQFAKESAKMLAAVQKNDVAAVKALLPGEISKEQLDEYISLLKPEPEETVDELKERYTGMFDNRFWNTVITSSETLK